MLIYMRHGDDHSEDNEHHHDRQLSDDGKRQAFKAAGRLIKKHGHPSIVYVSPFRRAIETAEAMTERFDRPVSVIHDPRIAKYFKKQNVEIGPALAGVVSLEEDKEAFRLRVDQHFEDLKIANHHRSDVVVWCITHKVVVKHAGRHFGEPTSGAIDFLDYLVIGA